MFPVSPEFRDAVKATQVSDSVIPDVPRVQPAQDVSAMPVGGLHCESCGNAGHVMCGPANL